MAIARDKFWIFGVRAHQDDTFLGPAYRRKDVKCYWSRITPAEAAFMLDVPNMMFISCDGEPAPFSQDAMGYLDSFTPMNNVLWSCTGSGGFRMGREEEFICSVLDDYPNVRGGFLDDYFGKWHKKPEDERRVLLLDLKKTILEGLSKANRPMELCSVVYTHELDKVDDELAEGITMIALFTSQDQIMNWEENIKKAREVFPNQKILLGIYLFEFSTSTPTPIELMEHQCEIGLKYMKEGVLDGMIFECNAEMGVGMQSELWLREWIKKNKYTEIPD